MLKSLYIKNYALITSLEIDFEAGFSVITGETGAGKSIILGALGLILGQRADIKAIKQGEDKCIIEGLFDVSAYDLKSFCEDLGIDYDSDSYIFRREILATGKSRAFINDTPVSLNDLRALGSQLIDIHSQHQNLLLGDSRFQMQVVDLLSSTKDLLKIYKEAYRNYKSAEKELSELHETALKSKDDEDYLRFQLTALTEAKLVVGEQAELEVELAQLNHAEEIKSALFKVHSLLADDERGVVLSLKESLNTTRGLLGIYPKAEEMAQRIESVYVDLKDLTSETQRYAADIEFNPLRLEQLTLRLDLIYSLQQKYRLSSVEELLVLQDELQQKLINIDSFDHQIELLCKELDVKKANMLTLAQELSERRKATAINIEKQLTEKVSILGMPNVQFECRFTPKQADATGIDELDFLFSANKNIPLQIISEVASGGEISRVMLCLKAMIAGATALPTIIFDEIDTGVSGEVADKMGLIMQEFGKRMQVLAITHLPQIAAKGNSHYFVYKTDSAYATTTNLRKLSNDERIRELAQMLSGAQITDAAIKNAKEMLGENN